MSSIFRVDQSHLRAVTQLFNQYRIFYKMPSNSAAASKFMADRLHNNDAIVFICYRNNTAAGFAQIYPSFSSVAMKPIWVLNDLFIAEQSRRLGCARELLNYIDQQASEAGIFSIKLATAVDNFQAKALYDSAGYKKMDQFDHYSKSQGLSCADDT